MGRLPCVSESFDLATAFETIYFWPGLKQCFAQVARVLQPGGLLLIVNESDGMDKAGRKYGKIIEGMTVYTAGQIEAALHGAGFSIVKTEHHPSRPWIAVRATKADSVPCLQTFLQTCCIGEADTGHDVKRAKGSICKMVQK